MAKNGKQTVVLLILILLAGLGVRFYGLGWGLPYHFNSDEFLMAATAEQIRTTDSLKNLIAAERKFFLYPPMIMFLNIGLVSASTLFRPFNHGDPSSLKLYYLFARGIVALFGVATIFLLFLLGRRVYSRKVGLLAALFLAFTVIHVRDSHFFCTDVPLTFFLVLILYLCKDIVDRKTMKSYFITGIATGVAVATKQTALLVVPVILVAHVMALGGGAGGSWLRRWRTFWTLPSLKKMVAVFGTAALVFLIANPFVIMNPAAFLDMSGRTFEFLKGANQPQWSFQFTGAGVGYWFTNLLFYSMGPALEILCLLGLLWALWKRKWLSDGLILLFVATYFISIGFGYMKFIRYTIPLLPFLCLLGARMAIEFYELVGKRLFRYLTAAIITIVALLSIFYTLAYLNIYKQTDVRIQASRWIHENIPVRSTVLFNISYATPLFGEMFFRPHFFDNYTVGYGQDYFVKEDFFRLKALNFFTYASRSLTPPEVFSRYIRERLADADYIVMSDEHSEQYSYRAGEYPTVVQFFRRLYEERLGFKLVGTFAVGPSFLGIPFNDDRAELTFRLFDHPKVRIFKRTIPKKT